MKLYTPLESHLEYLTAKHRVYSKYPKWWDFKHKSLLGLSGFFMVASLLTVAVFKLNFIAQVDAAIYIGFIGGIGVGWLFTVSLIDDLLIKSVK